MQKRRNSSALAVELRLFCIKTSIWYMQVTPLETNLCEFWIKLKKYTTENISVNVAHKQNIGYFSLW